jgi:hypothetical protein
MLVLGEKSYVPKIKRYCGNFIEIENIKNQITVMSGTSYFSDGKRIYIY